MKDVVEREFKGRVRWTEVESLDTRNNAEKSAVLLKASGIERIALVTHGWHMVRAAKDFEHAGLQVLPAPMGFKGGSHASSIACCPAHRPCPTAAWRCTSGWV